MGSFRFIIQQSCHHSWDQFFTLTSVKNELTTIESLISSQVISPAHNDIFKVFQCDLTELKVVIMGQDPYPQPNAATGRAFEVGNMTSWGALGHLHASQRNILKLLHYNKMKQINVQNIDAVLKDQSFISGILAPDKLFLNWEQQGVLLLNAALTCPQGNTRVSNAHAKIWRKFTSLLITFIDSNNKNLSWFLWGKAREYSSTISHGIKYLSYHPRNNSTATNSFYSQNHFSKISAIKWA